MTDFCFVLLVSDTNEIGFDIDFLESKGITEEAIDEDNNEQLTSECNTFVVARLQSEIDKYEDELLLVGGISEVQTTMGIGYLYLSYNGLSKFDHIFKKMSETTHNLHVCDLTSMLYQGYDNGEYDDGSLTDDPGDYLEYLNSVKCELADYICSDEEDCDEEDSGSQMFRTHIINGIEIIGYNYLGYIKMIEKGETVELIKKLRTDYNSLTIQDAKKMCDALKASM